MFFTEFGVVLAAERIDPKIVNEVTLRSRQIISEDDDLSEPSILTPVFANLIFSTGLVILAQPNQLQFTQHGKYEDGKLNRCPHVAKQCLEFYPIPSCTAIGVNFKAVVPDAADEQDHVGITHFFNDNASWAKFRSTEPNMNFHAVYERATKTINLSVGKTVKNNDPSATGVMYQVNFHRDLKNDDYHAMSEELHTILTEWNSDLDEFCELIEQLQQV